MNKRFLTLLLCVLLTGIYTTSTKAQKALKPAAQEVTLTPEEKLAAKRAVFTEKAIQMLKSKEWAIYVTVKPATEKRTAVIETDTLAFTDRTVLSKNLSSQGYSKGGSNYSLSVADDGSAAVWETMQMQENEKNIAFLRGELDLTSRAMRGSIVYKSDKSIGASYGYTTIEPAAQAISESPSVSGTPKTEETKKSKKRGEK